MNVISRILARGRAVTPVAVPIKEKPCPLHYGLSTFKWHMDSRAPSKLILVHDLFGSSACWQLLLHEGLGRLPCSGLTPRAPLELYAVELRGHNRSRSLPCPEDGNAFTRACAADIVLLQRQVLRADATLIGLGFGALVACQAALHSPDSGIESLVLMVSEPSELLACDPTRYLLHSYIASVPKDIGSFMALEQYLRGRVPHECDRALILAAVELQGGGALRFKFDDALLKYRDPLYGFNNLAPDNVFTKPVVVIQCGPDEFSQEVRDEFMKLFPDTKFVVFDGDRNGGVNGLSAQGPAVTHALLKAMQLMDQTTSEEA